MRSIKKLFSFETKSLFNLKTFSVIFVFLLVAIPLIRQGIDLYSDHTKQCGEFQRLEQDSSKKSIKAIQNGLRGLIIFNTIARQTPVSFLFHGSALFDNPHSTIDNSGVLLDIASKSSKNIPEKRSGLFSDLPSYIKFVLGFLSSLFGLYGTCDKKRLRFLLNMGGRLSVSAALFLSRQLYIIITLTLLFITVFLCFLAKGVPLSGAHIKDILINFGILAVFLSLFLFVGLLAGLTKSMFKGAMVVATAWMTILFIIPGAINVFFINPLIDNMKSLDFNKAQKFHLFIDFYNSVKDKVMNSEKSDRLQLTKDFNDQFLNVEYEKIKKLEVEMIRESEALMKKICLINIFSPGTFYESVSGEMTVGYRALLDFHKFNFEKQQKIVEFYIKSYFDKSVELPDIPVVYQSKSYLPYYFTSGLLFNILLVILAFILFHVCFLKAVFPRVKKNFKGVKIKAHKGDYFLLNLKSGGTDFSNKMFNTFFKRKSESFAGEITVDDRSIPDLKAFYLPDLKDVKPGDLKLLSGGDARGFKKKPFADLSSAELTKLFPRIEKCDILFIDNAGICIEPQENIVILELDSSVTFRKYTKLYFISLDKDAFEVKISKENSGT